MANGNFIKGYGRLELGADDVMDALEYWLNHCVFKQAVSVISAETVAERSGGAYRDTLTNISLVVEREDAEAESSEIVVEE